MTSKQVENLLSELLHEIGVGNRMAIEGHRELLAAFNVHESNPTAENWAEVEYRAYGAMMCLPRKETPSAN